MGCEIVDEYRRVQLLCHGRMFGNHRRSVLTQQRGRGRAGAGIGNIDHFRVGRSLAEGIRCAVRHPDWRSERGSPGEFDWLEKLSVEDLRLLAAGELEIESYQPSAGADRPSVN